MRRVLSSLLVVLLAAVYLAPQASGEPVTGGEALGAGWRVAAPGISSATLVPSETAVIPDPCPDSGPCEAHKSDSLVEAEIIGGTWADASAITSEAHAFKDPAVSSSTDRVAVLRPQMAPQTSLTLPTEWNLRGYGSVSNFSALSGLITADLIEAEAVAGTRTDTAGDIVGIVATGAKVAGLRIVDPVTTLEVALPNEPNTTVTVGTTTITYWETNWDPTTGGTTDGQRAFVNTLHIVDATLGVDIIVARAEATSVTYAPPPPPEPPTAVDDEVGTLYETPIDIDVLGNDTGIEDDDSPTITIVTPPDHGEVDCSSGECRYRPDDGYHGTDTFTYEVCDDEGCDQATVTVHVNGPPTADDDEAQTLPGTMVDIDVLFNDEDPENDLNPAIIVVTGPANGTVACSTGICTYEPNGGFSGRDSFTYRICDGAGQCDTATVTITVADPPPDANNPPVAEDDSARTTRNSSTTINVIGNDHDPDEGDSLRPGSVRVLIEPANGTVTCTGGSCTYTPNTGFVGTDTFTYEVCDQAWECDWATVTITVDPPPPPPAPPVNQPPTADDDTVTAAPGTPTVIDVIDNDDDPENDLDPDSVRVVDGPSNGTADCAAGQCTYTPDDGFTGTDEFTYEVCDGAGKCDQATVVIVVEPTTPDNSPPSAQDDEASTRPGIAVPITVTQNDSDPDGDLDTSSVRVVQAPSNGTVDCFGSVCTYTPDDGFTGTDSFVYEVCDAEGACDTAVVTIVVDEGDNVDGGAGDGDGDGNGNGPGGGSGGPGGGRGNSDGGAGGNPDLVTNPSRPDPGDPSTSFPPATSPPLLPSLGAPGSGLPFTGTPAGYLAIALYLLGAGTLSLIGGRLGSRRSHPKNAEVWAAPPSRPAQPKPARHPEAGVQSETPEPATSGEATTKPRPAARRKPAAKKASAKKTATKTPTTKKSTANKTAVKKTTTKKSTTEPAAKKKAVAKKSAAKKPVANKSTTKVTTKKTAAKTTTKKTAAKKATRRATTTKKSTVAKKPSRAAASA